ncbi:MAG: hypothetical protein P8Y13_13100 [Deinococcales bacterium]|jgi:hypothetical protein
MPHPWWQFWQIGDFLVMLAIVVLFVRFMRRSDARSGSEPLEEATPQDEDAAPPQPADDDAPSEPRSGGTDAPGS